MIGTIFAFLLVVGFLLLALREYLSGRFPRLRLLVIGAILGFVTISAALWDWLAEAGRTGDLAAGLTMLLLLAWSLVVWPRL
jgi:hypothetical protein